jgi:hypothetical protein
LAAIFSGTVFAKYHPMPRPLRYIPADSIVEVTTRTIQGRRLLRPSPELNDLILGILGRAQSLFPVRIHAFVVLSNHWHGLLSVNDAAELAAFVAFVNGNIAREVGRIHGWRERFWGRRYRAIVVADEASQVARLRYLLQNGCKEGLVDRPVEWPGLSCVEALTRNADLQGTWHDRTAESKSSRRGREMIPGQFAKRYRVTLAQLPCWRSLSPAQHRAACADLISEIEAETLAERVRSGKACVGAAALLSQNPHEPPAETDRSPAPFVHAACRLVRVAFRQAYAAFVEAFRAAAECLGRMKADFPPGAFPPSFPFVPAIADAD